MLCKGDFNLTVLDSLLMLTLAFRNLNILIEVMTTLCYGLFRYVPTYHHNFYFGRNCWGDNSNLTLWTQFKPNLGIKAKVDFYGPIFFYFSTIISFIH